MSTRQATCDLGGPPSIGRGVKTLRHSALFLKLSLQGGLDEGHDVYPAFSCCLPTVSLGLYVRRRGGAGGAGEVDRCHLHRLQLWGCRAGDIDRNGSVRGCPFDRLQLWSCRTDDIDGTSAGGNCRLDRIWLRGCRTRDGDDSGSFHGHPLNGLQLWQKPGASSRLHPRCRCRCPRA